MTQDTLFGYRLRPQQAAILAYQGGRMAVSAVPGSGKTLTLALLAARVIVQGRIGAEGEVLVVTMQNAAVDNISQRIRRILLERRLPPVGYHVCTLHKLAADILRQRSDLAGVEDNFVIVDEAEAQRTMHNAAEVWIAGHKPWWLSFLSEAGTSSQGNLEDQWRIVTEQVGLEVTKLCKHLRLTPSQAQEWAEAAGQSGDFLPMALDLYAQYSRYLQARSGLDFDDLIWRAIQALSQDEAFLNNLRMRWPYILEDEAQDSSPLQEQILDRLAGSTGNWVRMGDPNQAIHSTFTAADPRYFRSFVQQEDVTAKDLPQSGRSGQPIMNLANELVRWACDQHPEPLVRDLAFVRQYIEPTGPGDAQANPPDDACRIYFHGQPFPSPEEEAARVAAWAASYVRRFPERTVAVLSPTQRKGSIIVGDLESISPPVPCDDLLRSTPQTRNVAQILAAVLAYLGNPTSRASLGRLYATLAGTDHLRIVLESTHLRRQRTLLNSLAPHNLLFPREAVDVRELLPASVPVEREDAANLHAFAQVVSRWVRASDLPVDQLLLTMAQDLFTREIDLAICHTFAASLRSTSEMHPEWRLPDFARELAEVARNRRTVGAQSLADAGYTPQAGHVVVTTMHKAKGLEWDAVFLTSVDNLEFPDSRGDAFRDEPYFMPGRAPAVEARKRMEQIAYAQRLGGPEMGMPAGMEDLDVVDQSRLEYIAERLRLLYVGITRARRDLAFTWSETSGRRRVQAAASLVALGGYVRAYGAGQEGQGGEQ